MGQRLAFLFWIVSGLFAARAETILVLPFFNDSNSANLDWIGESISETVRESLISQGLLALEREDRLEAFRRLSLKPNARLTRASVIKAGEALDAGEVIYGEYTLTSGTLRISARVLNLKRFQQGGEMVESGALEDLAAIESRFSWQVLDAVTPKSAPSEDAFLRERPRVRLDALENYIRGLLATNPDQQRRFFTQAAHLDENYSQPCFQLGKWYWARKDYRGAAPWLRRVTRSDPHYMEAQFFLGLCDYQMADYTGAAKCFETVAAAVPLNEVFNDLGASQAHANPAAAIESYRKALEGDSSDLDYQFNLACALLKAGQYPAAAETLRAVLERNPNDEEAAALLSRAERKEQLKPGGEGRERLKTNYEETAYRQLKAELESKKGQ